MDDDRLTGLLNKSEHDEAFRRSSCIRKSNYPFHESRACKASQHDRVVKRKKKTKPDPDDLQDGAERKTPR